MNVANTYLKTRRADAAHKGWSRAYVTFVNIYGSTFDVAITIAEYKKLRQLYKAEGINPTLYTEPRTGLFYEVIPMIYHGAPDASLEEVVNRRHS